MSISWPNKRKHEETHHLTRWEMKTGATPWLGVVSLGMRIRITISTSASPSTLGVLDLDRVGEAGGDTLLDADAEAKGPVGELAPVPVPMAVGRGGSSPLEFEPRKRPRRFSRLWTLDPTRRKMDKPCCCPLLLVCKPSSFPSPATDGGGVGCRGIGLPRLRASFREQTMRTSSCGVFRQTVFTFSCKDIFTLTTLTPFARGVNLRTAER